MSNLQKALQGLPAVDKLLQYPEVLALISEYGKETVTFAIRQSIDFFRDQIKQKGNSPSHDDIMDRISAILHLLTDRSLKKVYNATGIAIHTNLGRSPFGKHLLNESFKILEGYNNLEFNLATADRGNRNDHAVALLKFLTGAEDILVVNNAAAAVMLCLRTFAKNKEVIVSRGELIEIGGSFRVPDIMAASDCKMVEVGTTNKTKPDDYRKAVTKKTAMLFKAHKSNYIIKGFTEEVDIEQLCSIGKELGIPVMYDQGSGLLRKIHHPAFADEPDIRTSLSSGVDLICFSGDKLLGGPQAGIIAGKKICIDKLKKEPMLRALRVCKTTLALLETACSFYLKEEVLMEYNVVFKSITQKQDGIDRKVQNLKNILLNNGIHCEEIENNAQIGGGSLPDRFVQSKAVVVKIDSTSNKNRSDFAEKMYQKLLQHSNPVLGILKKGNILFDVLTIEENEMDVVAQSIIDTFQSISNLKTEQ